LLLLQAAAFIGATLCGISDPHGCAVRLFSVLCALCVSLLEKKMLFFCGLSAGLHDKITDKNLPYSLNLPGKELRIRIVNFSAVQMFKKEARIFGSYVYKTASQITGVFIFKTPDNFRKNINRAV
jgi:hypothetical protein